VEQHLPQEEIQKAGLSVQAPGLLNNDTFEVSTLYQHIIGELSGAMSEEGKIMVIAKMVLNLLKQTGCQIS
jgi:hypothetical protein